MLSNPLLWKRSPGQMMEFLLGLDVNYLAETLVAFANADGGTIVIGMDASGEREEGIFLDDVA
ncbi:MAG: ATP-binding protein, partial [Anaerolineae bacterium]